MIYVSSSCVKKEFIKDSIAELSANGINHIELSGGTKPYSELESDLMHAKQNGAELLVHNYFPPPVTPFVLNLASVNKETRQASLDHCKRAIELSSKLGAQKFGMHAGFLLDISVNDIGKKLSPDKLVEEEKAYDIFCESYRELLKFSDDRVKLYVENNVLSAENYETFGGKNPLMLTDAESYARLAEMIGFNLLLDAAHLKVSCNSLSLDFQQQLNQLFELSDYIHLSDNDGLRDNNRPIEKDGQMIIALSQLNGWTEKSVTLEIYDDMESIKDSLNVIKQLVDA